MTALINTKCTDQNFKIQNLTLQTRSTTTRIGLGNADTLRMCSTEANSRAHSQDCPDLARQRGGVTSR